MKVIFAKAEEIGNDIPSGIIYYAEDTKQIYLKTDISGELKTYGIDATGEPAGQEYSFESYNPAGDTKWGEGKVITTGLKAMGKSQVKVIENTEESFVGNLYWITSNATVGNNLYTLYNDDNGNSAGIKVKLIG